MSLATLSREAMRGLKAQTDEENRLKTVAMFVNNLYSEAVRTAKMTEKTLYEWPIPHDARLGLNAIANSATATAHAALLSANPAIRGFPAASKTSEAEAAALHRSAPANVFTTSMADILNGLQELFPDCLVEHKMLVRGPDGKMYDISKMDKAVLPFIRGYQEQAYIVIDWS
jgi:hypothetical protein